MVIRCSVEVEVRDGEVEFEEIEKLTGRERVRDEERLIKNLVIYSCKACQ